MAVGFSKRGDKIEKLSHSWVEFALSLIDYFHLLQQTFDIFIRNLMFSKWVTCLAKPAWGHGSTTSHIYCFNEWFTWMIHHIVYIKIVVSPNIHQNMVVWGVQVFMYVFFCIHQTIIIFLCSFFTMHDFLRELWRNEIFPFEEGLDLFHQTNHGC